TRGRKRLIPVLLYADDGAAGGELDRMMNLRAEVRRAQKRSVHEVEILADRLVASQDAQPLGAYTELRDRVVYRRIGSDHEPPFVGREFTQRGRDRQSELAFEPVRSPDEFGDGAGPWRVIDRGGDAAL